MKKRIQKINPSKKIRGVRIVVFCGKCKRDLTNGICHKTKEEHCHFSEYHELKYYLHVPNGDGKRVVKVLKGVKSIDEAQRIAMNHKQELRNNRIAQQTSQPIQEIIYEQKKEYEPLLKDLLAQHLDVLSNYKVAPHLQRPRSKSYLDDKSRAYKYLLQALQKQGRKINAYYISNINDIEVGIIHDFLLDKDGLGFSNRSYSKHMQYYSTFLDWCIIEQGIGKINYFKKVPKRTTHYTPEIISKDNFDKLIKKITPENGIQIFPDKKRKKRNYYTSWLAYALKIALETGRRRPEIVDMKMSDIYSEDSIPIYIKVADSKVNNILNLQEDSKKKYVYVPITPGLYELIKDGYEEYHKTKIDRYIIASEITKRRKEKMHDSLSRGFSHYYKKLDLKDSEGNPEELSFGCLRKTYLTSMEIHSKGQTALVSGHGSGGRSILSKHYIDPKAIASVNASTGFSVFPEENNTRKKELSKIRERRNTAKKNLEK